MEDNANMATRYEHEIPEGYEARIEGNKVIIELKEPEDERIRKEIVGFIDSVLKDENVLSLVADRIGDDIPNMIPRWLVYLEKQKEQKPVDVSEKIEELCSKYPLNKDVMSKETLSAYHQGLTFGAARIAEYLGEQKPAEWSEEDERMFDSIIGDINIADKRMGGTPTSDIKKRWLENRFKSLRPCPQKEWTIEDAKPGDILHTSSTASSNTFIFKGIRNDEHGSVECFCCYDSEDGFRKGEETFIGWKADKYRLATTEQCIELGRIMGRAGYIFSFETNQLRKLNEHQWKPSEEQLSILGKVFAGCELNTTERDSMVDLFYNLKQML